VHAKCYKGSVINSTKEQKAKERLDECEREE